MGPAPDIHPTPLDRPDEAASARPPVRKLATAAERARPTIAVIGVGFITLFVCLLALGRIAELVHRQEVVALDGFVTPLLHAAASPMLDQVMWSLTTIGSTMVVAPLFVAAEVLLLRSSRRREALFLAAATLGSVLLNASMKLFFQRPRPQLPWAQTPLDYSFPSGHTMNSLVFYLALALVIRIIGGPRVGMLAVAIATTLAVLIGISRIYLGAHYFSDVAAGFLAGLAWLVIVSAAFDASDWFVRWRGGRRGPTGAAAPARPRQ